MDNILIKPREVGLRKIGLPISEPTGELRDIFFYDGIHKKWVSKPPTYTSKHITVGLKATGVNTGDTLHEMCLIVDVRSIFGQVCRERRDIEDVETGGKIEGLECKGSGDEYARYVGVIGLHGDKDVLDKWHGTVAIIREVEPPPPPPGKASLAGFIHDEESGAIVGVTVRLNTHLTSTNEYGNFVYESLDPGEYSVNCSKEGYATYRSYITLVKGKNSVDIEMVSTWREKRDPLDTLIRKMENIRPMCPIVPMEKNWLNFTEKVIEITPAIRILPPE